MTASSTDPLPAAPRLEIWGGVECTINRIGDTWFNQCRRNGHCHREDDIEAFAKLGVKRLRHGVLWEAVQGDREDGQYDFARADRELARMRELAIEPIVGLLHHGSGPRTTSLVDPEFPEKFARYAKAVAERYPWVRDYTPINEILTTARFSGLYGIWYPHARDHRTFLVALFNEVRGTILAMQEIRKVNPQARLIQTDDLGRCRGTEPCLEQAAFENERRWLAYDLLFGRVDESHALWGWLVREGAPVDQLNWIRENACPPDVVGINHYLLSNRWLDHRVNLYPPNYRGGNGFVEYADVGAVQTLHFHVPEPRPAYLSPEEILRDVIARYPHSEIAVTEVHVDGPREAQLQWIQEVWGAAQRLHQEGAKVVAITAWSLLGSFDWNALCTVDRGYYESGVFDVRSGKPRATAIGAMLKDLATDGKHAHPVLANAGWWRSPKKDRLGGPMILITGATGTLGRAFARICHLRGLNHRLVSRQEMDITDLASVRHALDHSKPWMVINTAGYVRVDEAETDRDRVFRDNVLGPEILASECRKRGIPVVNFSSDLVFDGRDRINPYLETAPTAPLNTYGQTKVEMESRVRGENPESMIVRTSSFFGPWDEHNFVWQTLARLAGGETMTAAEDLIVSPTYVPALAHATLDLMIDGLRDVVHLTNAGAVSWAELARRAARMFGLDESIVQPASSAELGFRAPRPAYSALGSERVAGLMTSLDEALDRYKFDLDPQLFEKMKHAQAEASTATEAS